jgi:hypothetical protein
MIEMNPREFVERAQLGGNFELPEDGSFVESPIESPLNLDKLPDGVVSGTTLIDFSKVPSVVVRAGVSLSMLFASRVATGSMKGGDDEDDWLAAYTHNLSRLGFYLSGTAVVNSKFKKNGLSVHKAIIPFLTLAFGGAAVGPIILAGLKNLQEADKDQPWIRLFDYESRRFSAREMHFAAVSSTDMETNIRYAIARLNVDMSEANVLFFNVTNATAEFESVTTTMTANNSLLAVVEPDLRERLSNLSASFIKEAKLSG